MKKFGYIHLGFDNSFERFNAILHIENNLKETYHKFNRNITTETCLGTEKHIPFK